MFKPPITLSMSNNKIQVSSLDECETLVIDSCEYADIIPLQVIAHAQPLTKNIGVYQSTLLLEKIRKISKNTNVGVAVLNTLFILVIIDDKRDVFIA